MLPANRYRRNGKCLSFLKEPPQRRNQSGILWKDEPVVCSTSGTTEHHWPVRPINQIHSSGPALNLEQAWRDTIAMGRGIGNDRVVCGWHQGRSTNKAQPCQVGRWYVPRRTKFVETDLETTPICQFSAWFGCLATRNLGLAWGELATLRLVAGCWQK